MTRMLAPAPEERLHKALSSPARRRIVELLDDHEQPLDTAELAEHLALHPNTVRSHLAVLEEAELVTSEPEQRGRPGRPRLLYRTTEAARTGDDQHGYRFLADVLAGQLAVVADDPAAAAEAAGAAWGRYLVQTPPPSSPLTVDDAIGRLVDLLARFGFDPQHDDSDTPRMLLRRCPFLQVAREHEDVICSIHLGIMRGALEELAVAVEVTDLIPFAEADLCVAHLAVRQ